MTNLFDYVSWRGDIPFKYVKLNKIDCLLFSQIIMLDLEGIIPSNKESEKVLFYAAKQQYDNLHGIDKKIGLIIPITVVEVFYQMSYYERYKNLELSDYVNYIDEDTHCQFCGMTVKINDNMRVIVLSGTDDTIAGWKENVSMIYKEEVIAQKKAVEYVEEIISKYGGKFIICGHSKGGHLALYTTLKISDSNYDAIVKTFNFDGQGIDDNKLAYNRERLVKITTYLPSGAIVGKLFDHPEKQRIIHSECKSLYQHDAFSWEIIGKEFVYENQFLKDCEEIDKLVKMILNDMDNENREKFVTTLCDLLDSTGAKTLSDLSTRKMAFLSSYFKIEKSRRRYISEPVKKLFKNKVIQSYFLKTLRESKKYKVNK